MRVQLRAVQIVYGALIAACGVAFLVWARLWPEAMAVQTYGYAAYDTDAEIWALAYVSAGGMIVIGAGAGGLWWGGYWARLLGYALLALMSYLLALSAWPAPHGAPVVIFSAFFFGPAAVLQAALTVREMRAGRNGRGTE